MDSLGINPGFLFVQLMNLALLAGWPLLTVLALIQVRHRGLPEIALAIWVVVILFIPIAGSLAFWIVRPGRPTSKALKS